MKNCCDKLCDRGNPCRKLLQAVASCRNGCRNGSSQNLSQVQLLRQHALRHGTRHALRHGKPRSQAGCWPITVLSGAEERGVQCRSLVPFLIFSIPADFRSYLQANGALLCSTKYMFCVRLSELFLSSIS